MVRKLRTIEPKLPEPRLALVVALMWLVCSALVFVSWNRPQAEGDDIALRMTVALFAPPVFAVIAFCFLALWWLLFDELPKIVRRWWLGPPWRTPRLVHPFSSGRDAADHADLMARLTLVDSDHEARTTLYVDQETGQYWQGTYFEQGFGLGEMLTPVEPPPAD